MRPLGVVPVDPATPAVHTASSALSTGLRVHEYRHAFATARGPIGVRTFVTEGLTAWPSARDILLITILGVFCTALAHTLFVLSLRGVSAHAASVVSLLEPVYGIALAAALLGQHPDARTLAGAALIVGAALTATRRSTP